MTYLLHEHQVSWGFYLFKSKNPNCAAGVGPCSHEEFVDRTEGWWTPLPYFDTVRSDHHLSNIQPMANFYKQAGEGALPSVSWISPSQRFSEHPPAPVSVGESYVTSLINQVLRFDAYLKFIEEDFLGGTRLDSRPTVREDIPIMGDLKKEFGFNQKSLPPMILPGHPKTDLLAAKPVSETK